MKRVVLWVAVVLGALVGAVPLSGKEMLPHWPYKKLQKEADVIVVGTFGKTVEGDQTLLEEKYRESLTVQKTTLNVELALKGDLKEETVDVLHVQFKEGHRIASGKISSLKFVARKAWTDGNGRMYGAHVEYMVFLKRVDKKPHFLPVSGLLYSEPSVRVMHEAFSE